MKQWTARLLSAWQYRKQNRLRLDRVVVLDLEATTPTGCAFALDWLDFLSGHR